MSSTKTTGILSFPMITTRLNPSNQGVDFAELSRKGLCWKCQTEASTVDWCDTSLCKKCHESAIRYLPKQVDWESKELEHLESNYLCFRCTKKATSDYFGVLLCTQCYSEACNYMYYQITGKEPSYY
jgi:hypothetical protein